MNTLEFFWGGGGDEFMMTSSNGNMFRVTGWPFVLGIHRSPVNFSHKASDTKFDVFFDLLPNKRLSKQSSRR